MPLIGSHISVAGGLYKAYQRADELNCEVMQVFTRNQRQWRIKALSMPEIEDFHRAALNSAVKRVVSHCSYLINLAGAPDVRSRSELALVAEIERCHQLGIEDVILHPGFAGDESEELAIRRIVDSLLKVLALTGDKNVRILLETMAGQGSVIGARLGQLERMLTLLDWEKRVGICVDTCHVFAAGYDLRTGEAYERLISQIDSAVGYKRICCWHLNDSKAERGSNKDRHTHLGHGEIGLGMFTMLMGDKRFTEIPAILETPKDGLGDVGNLTILRKLRGF